MNELLLRRRVAASKSLPYDAEVEWLMSDGSQFIDTGFMMDNSVESIHVVYRSLEARADRFFFGNRLLFTAFSIRATYNNRQRFSFFGLTNQDYDLAVNSPHKYDFTYDRSTGNVTIADLDDGTSSTTTVSIVNNEDNSFKIFGNTESHSTYRSILMFYQAEIETPNGRLELIPVRVSQTGYLYDKVSRQLIDNTGSGTFILSPDKGYTIPYTQIEYLQSSGTQYINLGIKPQVDELIEIKYQYVGVQSTVVMGCRNSSSSGKYIIVGSGTSGTKIYAALGTASNMTLIDFDQNVHSVVVNTSQSLGAADNGTAISIGTFSTNNLNIFLFAANQAGSASLQSTARIMEVKIGTRLWLVPVRNGQTGYMYDKFSGTLFGNAGTGSFILGPDKN